MTRGDVAARMGVLADLGREALATTDADALAARMVECAVDALELAGAAAFIRTAGEGVRLLASSRWPGPNPRTDPGDPVGQVLLTGEAVVVGRAVDDPRFAGCAWLRGAPGLVAAPIGGARPLGALAGLGAEGDDESFLQALANLIGTVLLRSPPAGASPPEAVDDRSIFEHSPHGIFVADSTGTYTDVNPAGSALLGYEREELIGMRVDELIPAGEPPLRYELLRRHGPVFLERRLRKKDGTTLPAMVGATTLPGGSLLGFVHETSARVAAEEALRSARDRLSQALRASHAGAWEWEIGSNRAYWSEELYELLGFDPETEPASTSRWLEAVHPDDRTMVREAVDRAASLGRDLDVAYRVVLCDGTTRWRRSVGKMVFDEGGEPRRMYGIQMDVTEQRAAEERARVAERLEAIGRLAGGVAHDFNNLLTVITGLTELMQRRLGEEHALQEHLRETMNAAKRGASLTQQLLAFGRRQALRPQRVQLGEHLRELAPMLRRLIGEDVGLEIAADQELPRVEADPGQLEQVVMNLVLNARDAMRGGGVVSVTCTTREVDDREAASLGVTSGRHVLLVVADTGEGMDERTRAQIFEPFFTTKKLGRGTGLGLATVYGVVRQSGGVIQVDSEPGRGTRFELLLPAVAGTSTFHAASSEVKRPTRLRCTILLVEDDPAVRRLTAELLTGEGHQVLSAASGDEALAVARAHEGTIDMLITDVVLRGSMNGSELWERLVQLLGRLPVLLVSGYVGDELLRRGVDPDLPLLPKPFSSQELLDAVATILW